MVPGSDTFHVATLDAFGQPIGGTLSPVSYNPNAPGLAAVNANKTPATTLSAKTN